MGRQIVEAIEIEDDPDTPDDEVTITFHHWYAEREYESMLDDFMYMTKEQLIELRDKISEVLA